jgi:hypothetical protein
LLFTNALLSSAFLHVNDILVAVLHVKSDLL